MISLEEAIDKLASAGSAQQIAMYLSGEGIVVRCGWEDRGGICPVREWAEKQVGHTVFVSHCRAFNGEESVVLPDNLQEFISMVDGGVFG